MNHLAAQTPTYEVTVMANAKDSRFLAALGSAVRWSPVSIERKIAPIRDLSCLITLMRTFRKERFNAVVSVTPKAGLLAMAAARLARVPVRIHWFTGQVWATRSGMGRALLKGLDRLLGGLATHLLVDSTSQRGFLASEGVAPGDKMKVLARGSIAGVDVARFRPDPAARCEVRAGLGVPEAALVFLFVGRCTFDKGLTDLACAFDTLCSERADAYLVIVGPDEEGVVPGVLRHCPHAAGRIRRVDHTDVPERYMAAADVFCLPSYREGFGAVIIEAAAAGVPSIGSRIYGITDAIVDGITGLLHKPRDPADLLEKMRRLARDPDLRRAMGIQARGRAEQEFAQGLVTAALLDYLRGLVPPCTESA